MGDSCFKGKHPRHFEPWNERRQGSGTGCAARTYHNAIYVGEGVPKKVGHKRYIFAAKAQVAKKAYVVGLVVDEDHNGKRFYNHELTEIEDLDGPSLDRLPEGGITEANQGLSVLNLIRKKLSVNIDMFLQSAHHGAPLVSEGITRSISGPERRFEKCNSLARPDGNTHHQPGIGGGTLFQGISADVPGRVRSYARPRRGNGAAGGSLRSAGGNGAAARYAGSEGCKAAGNGGADNGGEGRCGGKTAARTGMRRG